MFLPIVLAVAASVDGSSGTCAAPGSIAHFVFAAQSQEASQQDPRPVNPPPAPAGEVAPRPGEAMPGEEAELGGNPAPIPTTRYFLERTLGDLGLGRTLDDAGIRIYGWTQGNYTFSSANDSNAPTTFNDRADYGQINQNWLEIVRPIDTTRKELQIGGRLGLIVPGYDYKYTRAVDLWETPGDRYGFDSVYMYAEVFVPGLGSRGSTVRIGRWGTTIGYEMIEAIATPFVSRSYNFQYNPFTHTGAQVTTELSDNITMYHGLVTGADVFLDEAATPSYVGGIKWTAQGAGTSIAANVFITGQGFDVSESFQHYDCYNLLLQHTLAEGWNYVLDVTYGRTPDTDPTAGGGSASWVGFANYLSHALNAQWTLNLRGEVFRDEDGLRTGTDGTYVAVTVGAQWMPNEWLMVRPFTRFDHNSNGPFEGDDTLTTGGLEAIVRW
jgi:hypothetical protein